MNLDKKATNRVRLQKDPRLAQLDQKVGVELG